MKYYLADACQNSFVLFDRLSQSSIDETILHWAHECLMREKKDDALILYDARAKKNALSARLCVLGCDRVIAEFCGNGARACAAYLFAHYPHIEIFSLTAANGALYELAKHGDGKYSVKLPLPTFSLNKRFIADASRFHQLDRFSYVEMLEPHLVLKDHLSDEALFEIGQTLNRDTHLFPNGINVNACHLMKNGHLYVKTYERGVQRLTKSCGTGSISCAAKHRSKGTVCVTTPGGALEVLFKEDGVLLKGPAQILELSF